MSQDHQEAMEAFVYTKVDVEQPLPADLSTAQLIVLGALHDQGGGEIWTGAPVRISIQRLVKRTGLKYHRVRDAIMGLPKSHFRTEGVHTSRTIRFITAGDDEQEEATAEDREDDIPSVHTHEPLPPARVFRRPMSRK